jgi:hypothetical protein
LGEFKGEAINVARNSISGIRSFLYALARILGDVDAVSKRQQSNPKTDRPANSRQGYRKGIKKPV